MSILAAFMVPHPPMIIPQVGRGSESQIEETIRAYEKAADEIAVLKPDVIIITSPHSVMYADYFHISPGAQAKGSFSEFGAPGVTFDEEYDEELATEICRLASLEDFPAGMLGEKNKKLDHGTMVPLWFIRKKYGGGKIIRIGLSGLPLTDHYKLGMFIRDAVENKGRRAVFIASGDLSHKLQSYGPYGYAPEGPAYDCRIMDVCSRGAFEELFDFDENFCDKAAECGHRSFVIMEGALDGAEVKAEKLSHQDITGVGYGVCTFYPMQKNNSRHFLQNYLAKEQEKMNEIRDSSDIYVQLARRSVESFVREHAVITAAGVSAELTGMRAGAFVSIHEHGKLRGCIGTIRPVRASLAEEIIYNAISAATEDPRFSPIREEELPWLEISVDVLGDPEDINTPDQLDVKRYGVIVSRGARRGLLLPDLYGVDTVEQQIAISKQKAGIRPEEEVSLQRFEVIRHR